jgi:hypothetical protein
MKILKNYILILAVMLVGISASYAQTSKKDKKAAKEAEFKQILESRSFTFTVQTINPMRGGTRQATSQYDVRFVKDSVISYLPYFGRAFSAPINPEDGGIKFTSTKFSYVSTPRKSGWDIVIKPTDTKDVRQLTLNATANGYGTLTVTSTNRDPISFYGYIEANKKAK